MKTALYIARRYLFAKKSHNVINVISAISAAGLAIGTAALVIILSVYNGFDSLIRANISDLAPDVLLCAEDGGRFVPSDEVLESLENDPRIRSFNCILEDNVFFTYGQKQGVARARGVDFGYEIQSAVADHVVEGDFTLYLGDIPQACLGASLAYENAVHPRFLQGLDLYYPDADRKVSMLNPAASLNTARVWPSAIVSISADMDKDLMIVPLGTMQELTGDSESLSAIEIRLASGRDRDCRAFIRDPGFSGYVLKDRYAQNPALYKMMKYEKFAIFMILIFIVIIVAFNIFGSLSMLIIEKGQDMADLRAMGATDGLIRRIFVMEGWLVSLLGTAVGLIAGLSVTALQQFTGIVKMPGLFTDTAYPVVIQGSDILFTAAGVMLTGLVIACAAVIRKFPDSSRH